MTQEQKDLLLRDLCGRLPYGVKVQYQVGSQLPDIKTFNAKQYDELSKGSYIDDWLKCTFKPYLLPLWRMTKKQKEEFDALYWEAREKTCTDFDFKCIYSGLKTDWFNKNHFDYRGLIPMGLAIDCTNLNIY